MPRKTLMALACLLALSACQPAIEAPPPVASAPAGDVPASDPAPAPSPDAAGPGPALPPGAETGSSLMSIDLTQPADIGFGEALFGNGEGAMHLLEPVPALGADAWVVVGQAGTADLLFHVFVPVAGQAPDRSRMPYQVASLYLPAPAVALDLEVDGLEWTGGDTDPMVEFRLERLHHRLREGGDPESGEGDTERLRLPLRLVYSRASGELRVAQPDS